MSNRNGGAPDVRQWQRKQSLAASHTGVLRNNPVGPNDTRPRLLPNAKRCLPGREALIEMNLTMRLQSLVVLMVLLVSGAAVADSISVLSITSVVSLHTGPSASTRRIAPLTAGTAVLELGGPKTLFKSPRNRWVHVHVLEGRASGREGWVWGGFLRCCKKHEWLHLMRRGQ